MRVWIEILMILILIDISLVTLYMRVWIEIKPLKTNKPPLTVTLYMRVWIEIGLLRLYFDGAYRHSLYESVD